MLLIEGFREAQIQLGGLQTMLVIQTRHLVQYLDFDPFVRLQANSQFVLWQLLIGVTEQVQRWVFKVHHYF
ncbi:hypothetical protein D3C76_1776060 [compost metagenome]